MSQEPQKDKNLPPSQRPAPPTVPQPPGFFHREETPLMEYLRQRMEAMERELAIERERARGAESLIKQQESLRNEVETQLKAMSDQMRQQKALQESEEERRASRGRVEALEKRLDEMHQSWASLLKDTIGRRDVGLAAAAGGIEKLDASLAGLKDEFSSLKESIAAQPKSPPEARAPGPLVPAPSPAHDEGERLTREQLHETVAGLGDMIIARMKDIGSRLAQESGRQNERLEQLTRERAALASAIERQREEARQEALRERAAVQRQLDEQMQGIQQAMTAISERQGAASDALGQVQRLSEAVHEILRQPDKAKDQILQGIEQEKRDLMKALKERTEQLRAYTIERREIERSLGESLMELNRQLESERASHQSTRAQIAGLERSIDALQAEGALRRGELEAKDARFKQLAAERDALVQALAEEAEKVRRQIEERARGDTAWEEKVSQAQQTALGAREKLGQAEQASADLRAQVQTLADHLSRLLREKETIESRYGQWEKERGELEEQLRKKDEMVAMLSATFRNLLKKPA